MLDCDLRELTRDGTIVPLQPQVFDLLRYLVEQRARVVSKDDLIGHVWENRIVSDSALNSRINAARKAIGDDGEAQRLIRTIPRKGFRFIGEVLEQAPVLAAAETPPSRSVPERPAIAVLAFENMSDEPEQENFCDGL